MMLNDTKKVMKFWPALCKDINLLVLLAFELIITSICHCFMICCIIVKQDVEILRGAVQLKRCWIILHLLNF